MKLNNLLIITVFITFFSNAQAPGIEWQKCIGGTNVEENSIVKQTSDGGYLIAGNTQSTDGDFIDNHGLTDIWVVKLNSLGNITWQKTLGGSNEDKIYDIKITNDNGFIIVGYSNSINGDVNENKGFFDGWIIKLNQFGNIEWQKTLGGSNNDYFNCIYQTSDNDYIVAGYTESNNGDVIGNHGLTDEWIVKLDLSGNIIWQITLGGTNSDYLTSIYQSTDNGLLINGYTQSNNGDVIGNHGGVDSLIIKLNSLGNIEWIKVLGGSDYDYLTRIYQTFDNGYILAGTTRSNNYDAIGNQGLFDYWVIKLNSIGNIEWKKTYGGSNDEILHDIKQTIDGGFILAGNTMSFDGDITGNHGNWDSWIVKLNSLGNIEWQKALGCSTGDEAKYIEQTIAGDYVFIGSATNNNGNVTGTHGGFDYWIVKLNSTGNIYWQKALGGSVNDISNKIQFTMDNGYIINGNTLSNNGNVFGYHGGQDAWIVKLTPDNLSNNSFVENTTISFFPNPAKEKITLKLNYFSPSQEITITNIQGKIIHTQKLEGLSTTINTSSFEKGIYFLNLTDGTQKTTKKFIVE